MSLSQLHCVGRTFNWPLRPEAESMRQSTCTLRSTLLAAATALLLLPGCKRFTTADCDKPQLYAEARNLAPLRIPAGLDAPNTRGAMKIPELNEPEVPHVKGDRCLDQPPRYSNARLEPPAPERKRKRGAAPAQPDSTTAPAPSAPPAR